MSLHEQFIPGRWMDDIDVNDFVKLNKKPFLDEPIFLKNHAFTMHPINLSTWVSEDKKVNLTFSSLDTDDLDWFPTNQNHSLMKRKLGISESVNEMKSHYMYEGEEDVEERDKSAHQVYQEIATSDVNKMLQIGLFHHVPYNYTPMFIFPDIRMIGLYGTKQILKEKRFYLSKLERHFQTTDWIQVRISKYKEIDAIKKFEKFAKKLGVNVSKPATTTKELIDVLYVTLLSVVVENPSISLSLSDIISFIDIFAEKELLLGLIKEEELQAYINEFVLKITQLRFTPSPSLEGNLPSTPFVLGETIGEDVTKTTYRFLSALDNYAKGPFVLRVIWSNRLPIYFKKIVLSLYDKGLPISLVSPRILKELHNPNLLPYGLHVETFDEIAYHAGGCNLEKALYLAINGGKEVESNTNLSAITSPLRQNQLTYDEVMNKFQNFLSFAILSFTEMMNALLYMHDIHHNHPLRRSLISNQPFYSVSFGFFHMKAVVNLLAAIHHDDFKVERKQQKWVKTITPNASRYDNEDVIMTHIVSFIKQELQKIPLYKEARHSVRFYVDKMYDTIEKEDVNYDLTLPPEYMKGNFHVNLVGVTLNEEFIRTSFSRNITELNVSKNNDFYIANGILFHRNYHLKNPSS